MSTAPELVQLEAYVDDGLSELIAVAQRRVASIVRERAKLDDEIATYSRRIRAWEAARQTFAGETSRPPTAEGQEPSKREAVLGFLDEFPARDFKLVEIRRGLIERGWMHPDGKAIHALEVAVTDMAARGEIARVRKGVYRLVAPHVVFEGGDEVASEPSIGGK